MNVSVQHPIYDVIFTRRDVRRFRSDPVPEEVLYRLLQAAHHAPSVGFMQPWNFIVVRNPAVKAQVKQVFLTENARAARHYRAQRRALYTSLKLEGILEAPINLCVTCNRSRFGPHVLGRNSMPETDLFSTCCAIQNFWLAACAEGIGVGWVSIVDPDDLRQILRIPNRIVPVAYLCVGYPEAFLPKPELELVGWAPRLPLKTLVFANQWGRRDKVMVEGRRRVKGSERCHGRSVLNDCHPGTPAPPRRGPRTCPPCTSTVQGPWGSTIERSLSRC